MNRLILKDERGAVETVPTSKGIATIHSYNLLKDFILVETVPTSKGIATVSLFSLLHSSLFTISLKIVCLLRALLLKASFHFSLFTTHPSLFTVSTLFMNNLCYNSKKNLEK